MASWSPSVPSFSRCPGKRSLADLLSSRGHGLVDGVGTPTGTPPLAANGHESDGGVYAAIPAARKVARLVPPSRGEHGPRRGVPHPAAASAAPATSGDAAATPGAAAASGDAAAPGAAAASGAVAETLGASALTPGFSPSASRADDRSRAARKELSPVWSVFTKIGSASVQCKLCDKRMGYDGSTGNIIRHLKRSHGDTWTAMGSTDRDIASLASISSQISSDASNVTAIRALGGLTQQDFSEVKAAVLQEPVVPALVSRLRCDSEEVKEAAALALGKLAQEDDMRTVIVKEGAIPRLITLLSGNSAAVEEEAAEALGVLAEDGATAKLIALEGAIPPLLSMLTASNSDGAKEKAAKILVEIARGHDNRRRIFEWDSIQPLSSLLKCDSDSVKERALQLMKMFASDALGSMPAVDLSAELHAPHHSAVLDSIPSLVSLLPSSSTAVKASALEVLGYFALLKSFKRVIADQANSCLVPLLECDSDAVKEKVVWVLRNLLEPPQPTKLSEWGELPDPVPFDFKAALPTLFSLVRWSSDAVREQVARLLGVLARERGGGKVVCMGGAIPPLVAMLGSSSESVAEAACSAMLSFTGDPYDDKWIVEAGAVPLLVAWSKKGSGLVRSDAEALLKALAKLEEA